MITEVDLYETLQPSTSGRKDFPSNKPATVDLYEALQPAGEGDVSHISSNDPDGVDLYERIAVRGIPAANAARRGIPDRSADTPTKAFYPGPFEVGGGRASEDGESDSLPEGASKLKENAPELFAAQGGGLMQWLGELPAQMMYGENDEIIIPGRENLSESQIAEIEADHSARMARKRDLADNELSRAGKRVFNEARQKIEQNRPDLKEGSAGYYAYLIGEAIANMAPATIASLATRNPNVGMSMIGGQVFGDQYAEARKRGFGPEEATREAMFYAATEGISERVPLGILTREGKSAISRVLKSSVAEGIQEPLTEAMQMAYEAGVLEEDISFKGALRRLFDAGVIGFGAGGGIAVATEPAVAIQRYRKKSKDGGSGPDPESPPTSPEDDQTKAEFEQFWAEQQAQAPESETAGPTFTPHPGEASPGGVPRTAGIPTPDEARALQADATQPDEIDLYEAAGVEPTAPTPPPKEQVNARLKARRKELAWMRDQTGDPDIRADFEHQIHLIDAEMAGQKPKLTAADRMREQLRVRPEKDGLLLAIQKLGGINTDIETDWIGEFHNLSERAPGLPGIERSGKGRSLDDLAGMLAEYGYIAEPDPSALKAKLRSAKSGAPVYSIQHGQVEGERAAKTDPEALAAAEQEAAVQAAGEAVASEEGWTPEAIQAAWQEAVSAAGESSPYAATGATITLARQRATELNPDAAERIIEDAARQGWTAEAEHTALLDAIADAAPRISHVGGRPVAGVKSFEEFAREKDRGELDDQALGFLDLDNFKALNDAHGHELGDEVIRLFGNTLRQYGGNGNVYRRSGDEFIVRGADRAKLEAALRRAQNELEGREVHFEATDGSTIDLPRLRFSLGTAPFARSVDETLAKAEEAQSGDKQERRRQGLREERRTVEGRRAADHGGAHEGGHRGARVPTRPQADLQRGHDERTAGRSDSARPGVRQEEAEVDTSGGRPAAEPAPSERQRSTPGRVRTRTDTATRSPRNAARRRAPKLARNGVLDVVARVTDRWRNAPDFVVVATHADLPVGLQQEIRTSEGSGEVQGALWGRSIYLVADTFATEAEVERTMLHEAVGHHGLRTLLGDKYRQVMEQVVRHYGRRGLRKIADMYHLDLNKRADRLKAAEEMLATVAESGRRPSILQRVIAAIRAALRRIGFRRLKLNESEILTLLARARRFVEGGGGVSGRRPGSGPAMNQREEGTDSTEARFQRRPAPDIYGSTSDGRMAAIARYDGREWIVWERRDAQGNLFDDGPRVTKARTADEVRRLLASKGYTVSETKPDLERMKSEPLFTNGFDELGPEATNYLYGQARDQIDRLRYYTQDRYIDLKRLQGAVEESTGKPLADDANAYMSEALYHGRAESRIEAFRDKELKPLIKAIADAGVTMDQVDDYLYARHARERNEHLSEKNAELRENEGSGMTTEEANEILADLEAQGLTPALEKIAKRVDAITRATRRMLVSEGLETQERVESWEKLYQHYVPLRGFSAEYQGDTENMLPPRGRGFHVRGGERRAFGRKSKASSPLTNVVAAYESTAVRAEKARVGRKLLRLVESAPNDKVWEINQYEQRPRDNPATGMVEYVSVPPDPAAENVLSVRVGGKDVFITFHGERGQHIARAMKNLGAGEMGPLTRGLAVLNRWLSLVNTGANPEFVLSNFLRDIQTAAINMSGTEAEALKWKVITDAAPAVKGIYSAIRGKGEGYWAEQFREFEAAGGKTGYVDTYKSLESAGKKLQQEYSRMTRDLTDPKDIVGVMADGWLAGIRWIEDANIAVENGVRLAAFAHVRDAGVSTEKAADLAKNLTVNFNRKGEWGPQLNAWYLFYNASLQGGIRIAQAMKSKKARRAVGGIMMIAAMREFLNHVLGGEDEYGNSYYNELPRWVRDRNMVWMVPEWISGVPGNYITIPLPYGYNVFDVAGQEIGRFAAGMVGQRRYGPEDAASAIYRVLGVTIDSFNPIGTTESLLQFFSPTFMDPIAQVAENKDWSGRPVYPEGNPFAEAPEPLSHRSFPSTTEAAKTAARGINDTLGGSPVRPGAVDIPPDALDLMFEYFTGGAGRFISETVDSGFKLSRGEDVPTYRIPFLGKVWGETGMRAATNEFYENARSVAYAQAELEYYRDQRDFAESQRIRREYKAELQMVSAKNSTRKKLSALRDREARIKGSKHMGNDRRRAALERIENEEERVMRRFNSRYWQAIESAD